MKIYLCNYTSKGHSGSKAVMDNLRKLLSNHEIIGTHEYIAKDFNADLIKKADAVVKLLNIIGVDKFLNSILCEPC